MKAASFIASFSSIFEAKPKPVSVAIFENKLIRFSVSSYSEVKCNLNTSIIQSSNTYQNCNNILHCPCYGEYCKTILFEIYDNKAYYLKSYIDGEPLCIEKYLSDPIKLAKLLAKAMNMVHLKYEEKTFVHGDFCLPNILVKDDEIVGIIDTCHAEFNDPWIDYAWCIWSYEYNLKTNIYTPILLKELNIEFDLEKYNKYIKNDDRI